MTKCCPSCGVEIKDGSRFCINCGIRIKQEPSSSKPSHQEQQLHYTQMQSDILQKKSKGKLMAAAIVIIILVALIIGVAIFLGGSQGEKNKFIGKWQWIGGSSTITFNADGTGYTEGPNFFGSGRTKTYFDWELSDGKLLWGNTMGSDKSDYGFKDNNTVLTITAEDGSAETFRKIS